jgi:hypothetical protein
LDKAKYSEGKQAGLRQCSHGYYLDTISLVG